MTRDYAKRNIPSKKPPKNYIYLWLILLLLFLIFVIGLIMMNKYYYHGGSLMVNAPTPINSNLKPAETTVTTTKTLSEPKFVFYSTLPSPKQSDQPIAKSVDTYELEIATLDNFAAADRLKAELALVGFTATITQIYKEGSQKYYITLGPYNKEERANNDVKKLELNHIKSKLKKIS